MKKLILLSLMLLSSAAAMAAEIRTPDLSTTNWALIMVMVFIGTIYLFSKKSYPPGKPREYLAMGILMWMLTSIIAQTFNAGAGTLLIIAVLLVAIETAFTANGEEAGPFAAIACIAGAGGIITTGITAYAIQTIGTPSLVPMPATNADHCLLYIAVFGAAVLIGRQIRSEVIPA